ncbi:hypothetical protein N657DRAFT_641210 [Parathielavia appendiculata]|uniref:Uncharacterized protein n=1 Tax=Parathielavia appendiculata TaxID=2587402 RepID=A0AAN6U748_9PEZI|nr:hypothetical protein N657DRAFT_641210 [Parathielavia appendiculata]
MLYYQPSTPEMVEAVQSLQPYQGPSEQICRVSWVMARDRANEPRHETQPLRSLRAAPALGSEVFLSVPEYLPCACVPGFHAGASSGALKKETIGVFPGVERRAPGQHSCISKDSSPFGVLDERGTRRISDASTDSVTSRVSRTHLATQPSRSTPVNKGRGLQDKANVAALDFGPWAARGINK